MHFYLDIPLIRSMIPTMSNPLIMANDSSIVNQEENLVLHLILNHFVNVHIVAQITFSASGNRIQFCTFIVLLMF